MAPEAIAMKNREFQLVRYFRTFAPKNNTVNLGGGGGGVRIPPPNRSKTADLPPPARESRIEMLAKYTYKAVAKTLPFAPA